MTYQIHTGVKKINTLTDPFKLAHQSLLKLKKNMKVYYTMRKTQRNMGENNENKPTIKNTINKTSKT